MICFHFQIGQYLMTLPQQLDPFTLDDNPALAVALKHSKLPYTAEQSQYYIIPFEWKMFSQYFLKLIHSKNLYHVTDLPIM